MSAVKVFKFWLFFSRNGHATENDKKKGMVGHEGDETKLGVTRRVFTMAKGKQ